MSKYDPLRRYLESAGTDLVPMSFAQIEEVLGFKLPPSARKHRPWWSNSTTNGVMTEQWLAAGYKSEGVDMAGERLTFRVSRSNDRGSSRQAEKLRSPPEGSSIIGVLKGTVTVPPGTDLTEPTGESWEAEA